MSSCGRGGDDAPLRTRSSGDAHAIRVATQPPYTVHVGRGVLDELRTICGRASRVFVLTDENVARHQGARLADLANATTLAVAPGEASKSFATLERVLDALAAAGLDRQSVLVAFGGGVVGDLGGLAAALYMRGIECVQVPTTLLAMVDSSVGGKTAINLAAGKNLAGVFHQPRLVCADPSTLATLADDEYRSGLGEVLKTAVLDADLFELVEREHGALVERDPRVVGEVVRGCVVRKAAIVAQDPHERGPRKLLNLGHTFAHAIEHTAGFGTIPHGVAVATGVVLAARLGVALGRAQPGLVTRIERVAGALALPTTLAELRDTHRVALTDDALVAAMRLDKKSRSGDPRFVVPYEVGSVAYDAAVPEASLRAVLRAAS